MISETIMTGQQITKIRKALRLSQTEFGLLLNAHFVTVSRWEKETLEPNAYQQAMLNEFEAAIKKKQFDKLIKNTLIGAGVAAALFLLLRAAKSGG